ncbi:hypothetical protein [Azohydromonas caseinilytica]|uniref:Uncharacterized protein n=1 Tax=Azohydromonas caseinilytica TaxID=2728836 RepID=A0A848FF74_9BURK|nr:hypothetical protein [Azohydromonas caseinilytica]NML18034.1 hypothetical protein [Azohydromonas caseinilytica]
MNPDKAADFWQAVLAHADLLRAPALSHPDAPDWEEAIAAVSHAVDVLAEAAAAFDERLSVEIDNTPMQDGAAVRLAVTCHGDPQGMEAVLALTGTAPALPADLLVSAFKPPVPREVLAEFSSMDFAGTEVQFQDVRYVAAPSEETPGRYDIGCFLPPSAATEFDADVPGISVAALVLGMGLGELKVMTLVARLGVLLTSEPPPDSVSAWELAEQLSGHVGH